MGGVRPYIASMNEDRDTTVRTDLPGDAHWYDLPDDEAEPDDPEPRRAWWRWS
jgi:hypothetical protein